MHLRILIPWTIFAAFCLDMTLRVAVAPDRLAFRGWEAAQLAPVSEGPFTPNFTYQNPRSYGDLANLGNLPAMRHYHSDLFTTDSWGFRLTPNPDSLPITTLVFGDSFTAGAGLNDQETLTAQLGSIGNIGAYNCGEVFGNETWSTIQTLDRRFQLKNGLIIYEQSERFEIPDSITKPPDRASGLISRLGLKDSFIFDWLRAFRKRYAYSPLRILLIRQFAAIQNDTWLPNLAARNNVTVRTLKNGQDILFLKSEIDDFTSAQPSNVDFFVKLQALVRSTHNELLVVLVPNKYEVYEPQLQGAQTSIEHPDHFSVIAQKLRESSVPVVDLTPLFRDQAASLLPEGQYNYRLDDTHWNAVGVKAAARAIFDLRRQIPAVP